MALTKSVLVAKLAAVYWFVKEANDLFLTKFNKSMAHCDTPVATLASASAWFNKTSAQRIIGALSPRPL